MIKRGKKKPGLLSIGIRIRKFYIINIEETQLEDGTWMWQSVELSPGDVSKSEIIDKLVALKYPTERLALIGMNYLSDQDDIDSKFDYEAFQAWKEEAGKIADKVLEEISASLPPA